MLSLDSIKCFIVDMDGTIYLSDRPLPGARDLLSFFDRRSMPYWFFTNNSSHSAGNYTDKLKRLGFGSFGRDRIISSTDVTADYILKTYGNGAKAYVAGTPALIESLTAAGIACDEEHRPDCVLVGFDTTLVYEKANKALELIREGVPFLATNIDAVCPLDGGKVLLDCGSICRMLTHASGVEPKFLGKPFAETAEYIKGVTGIPLCETAVIGDRLYTDMRFAVDNGMCSIGLLSGEMTRSDIDKSGIKLDYVFADAQELLDNLK